MDKEDIGPIITLVEKMLGLRPNSVSALIWEWVIKERMNLCNIYTVKEYTAYLKASAHEMQELIELVVIPETWFFRDKSVFDFLIHFVRDIWYRNANQSPLKIMSIPCSTGEEPYSIAMALLNENYTARHFKIDAMDISKKALIKAQMAVYGKNSFRGRDLEYRERYFEKTSQGYALKSQVKALVQFNYFNILNDRIPFEADSYGLIFCRNLLIYLDESSQQKTFEFIQKLLAPNGFLVTGSAEVQLARNAGFIPYSFPRACAFSLTNPEITIATAPPIKTVETTESKVSVDFLKETQQASSMIQEEIDAQLDTDQHIHTSIDPSNTKQHLIATAGELADKGDFIGAEQKCKEYLHQYGAHPSIYYLLALIKHAQGFEEQAEELFQKTIYLQPTHYEALIYLALLTERRGERNKAVLLRQRAQKFYELDNLPR